LVVSLFVGFLAATIYDPIAEAITAKGINVASRSWIMMIHGKTQFIDDAARSKRAALHLLRVITLRDLFSDSQEKMNSRTNIISAYDSHFIRHPFL